VHGGVGNNIHVYDLLSYVPVSGIAISSMFHYNTIHHLRDLGGYEAEGNIDFLKSNRSLSFIQNTSIGQLKDYLIEKNVNCRKHERKN